MMSLISRRVKLVSSLLLVAALAGCGGGANEDLASWMQEQRAKTQPKVEPISEPVVFDTGMDLEGGGLRVERFE